MTDWASEASIGARIQSARKARGFRTSRELAEAIVGSTVTESIIENIESGRKVNLDVSQLLSIAMALEVPPTYLLAPIGSPDAAVDLPNLSDAFTGMTAGQFDSWLSGNTEGEYRPVSHHERNARYELQAVRRWMALHSEIERLELLDIEEGDPDRVERGYPRTASARHAAAELELADLRTYLTSAGWRLSEGPRWAPFTFS